MSEENRLIQASQHGSEDRREISKKKKKNA